MVLGEEEQDLSGVGMEMPPKVRTPGSLFCLQPQACAGRRGKGLCDCECVRVCACVCVCVCRTKSGLLSVGAVVSLILVSDECD